MAMAALTRTAIRQRSVGLSSGWCSLTPRSPPSAKRTRACVAGARSPLQHEERDPLARQRKRQGRLALVDGHRGRAPHHRGELAGFLELCVLLLVGRNGRAHLLPGGERVAVVLVD